ncbi:MAG: DUF362 domain-containing protein [Desulfosudaceae bacterium]
MKSANTVAIVSVADHETLDEAVAAALSMIEADKTIQPEDSVLFKPNLLIRIKNACTESDFLASTARYVKQYATDLKVGDSPGQFRHRARSVMKAVGMDEVVEAEGLEYAEFESGGILITNNEARHMRHQHIARPVMEADCLINLCRPKSHIEAVYTGAVKNYWGIIPGGEKANCHLLGKNPEQFGEVLVDNYQALLNQNKKRIVVMDARRFMEGPGGPANGYMRKVGLILAGYDEVAIDLVMLAIGGRDGLKSVPHLRACRKRRIGLTSLNDINIVGKSIEAVRLKRKVAITSSLTANILNNFIIRTLSYKMMRRMPALPDKDDCVMCGDCFHICPNNAITWHKNQPPVFNPKRCVSCLCCVECCPQQALVAKAAGLSGLFLKYPRIIIPPDNPPDNKPDNHPDNHPD